MNTTRSYIGMRRNGGISRLFNNAKSVESCSLVSFNTFRGSEYAAVLDIIWVFLDLLDHPKNVHIMLVECQVCARKSVDKVEHM